MSDSRRFEKLAAYIRANFPQAKRIADVGGGKGQLCSYLCATLLELYPPRGFRRVDIRTYCTSPSEEYDLVIGLHPDAATWYCIALAYHCHCPFIIIPCCELYPPYAMLANVFPRGKATQQGDKPYIKWLQEEAEHYHFTTYIDLLNIRGKNLMLVGQP